MSQMLVHDGPPPVRNGYVACRSAPSGGRDVHSLRASSLKLNRQTPPTQQQQIQNHHQPVKLKSVRSYHQMEVTTKTTTSPGHGSSTGARRRSSLLRRSRSYGASSFNKTLGPSSSSAESPPSATNSTFAKTSDKEKEKSSPVPHHSWRRALPPLNNNNSSLSKIPSSSPVLTHNTKRASLPTITNHNSHNHAMKEKKPTMHSSSDHGHNLTLSYNQHWAQHYCTQKYTSSSIHKRRVLYRLLGVCILLGIAGFAVSIVLSRDHTDTTTTNVANDPSTTEQPPEDASSVKRPTSKANSRLRNSQSQLKRSFTSLLLAKSITTTDRLQDPFSPASAALDWLIDVSTHTWQQSDQDIISRFSLACLFFATHTTGSLWKVETHWMTSMNEDGGVHVCDWYGVACAHYQVGPNQVEEVVTQVNLTKNQLQGTIPEEFWNGLARDLVLIDLSDNQLWGTLPDGDHWWSRGMFPNLQTLYLHNNAMTGTIPFNLQSTKTILQKTNLKHASLKHNHFQELPGRSEEAVQQRTRQRRTKRRQDDGDP
ncbi:receptor-like protein kinase [Seminavis robusta]|uniref:Receptor-like protein kinase n=1 Tax=Seminavis robusta TaxID=568900 RepID=A0A9N8HLH8_9STRA|nr:receptor-like protein kinase [Seminavis robusta]|eukprot:Sro1032_g233530.1 receptor-like protein kinase (539) ;mRNA; r:15044-16660